MLKNTAIKTLNQCKMAEKQEYSDEFPVRSDIVKKSSNSSLPITATSKCVSFCSL